MVTQRTEEELQQLSFDYGYIKGKFDLLNIVSALMDDKRIPLLLQLSLSKELDEFEVKYGFEFELKVAAND